MKSRTNKNLCETNVQCLLEGNNFTFFLWQASPVQPQTLPRETNQLSLPLPGAANGTMQRVRLLYFLKRCDLMASFWISSIGSWKAFHAGNHQNLWAWMKSGWGLSWL